MLAGAEPAERMRISPSGNVNIGNSASAVYGLTGNSNLATNMGITFHNNSAGFSKVGAIISIQTSGGSHAMALYTRSGGDEFERMRITAGGYVGIGTTSPAINLHVAGTNNSAVGTSTFWDFQFSGAEITNLSNTVGTVAGLALIGGSSRGSVSAIANILESTGAGQLAFFTGGGSTGTVPERMRITSGGNVGIGTTNPSQRFEVVGGEIKAGRVDSSSEGGQISFGRASDNATGYYIDVFGNTSTPVLRFVDVSNSAVRMTLSNQGSLWINSTTASPTLNSYIYQYNGDGSRINAMFEVSVATPGFTSLAFRNPNGIVGSVAINENTVTYGGTSDYRLKEDLRDFDGLNKVAAIKVYDFKWKTSEERNEGVLAHELESIVPYAVTGEKDAIYEDRTIKAQMVDYSKLTPILIKAIQELKAENDKLKEILQRNNIQ